MTILHLKDADVLPNARLSKSRKLIAPAKTHGTSRDRPAHSGMPRGAGVLCSAGEGAAAVVERALHDLRGAGDVGAQLERK